MAAPTTTVADDLHEGVFLPHLLIAALDRHPDRPAVYLGERVLTGAEVRSVSPTRKHCARSIGEAPTARSTDRGAPSAGELRVAVRRLVGHVAHDLRGDPRRRRRVVVDAVELDLDNDEVAIEEHVDLPRT